MARVAAAARTAVGVVGWWQTGNSDIPFSADDPAISVTSDFTLICQVTPDRWNTGAVQSLMLKRATVGNNRGILWRLSAAGRLQLLLSSDGIADTTVTCSLLTPGAAGLNNMAGIWLAATWRAADGRAQFFRSSDAFNAADPSANTWTQLGTDQTANIGSIFDNAADLRVSGNAVNDWCTGLWRRAQLRTGSTISTSVLVWDARFDQQTAGATSWTEPASGLTITISGGGTAPNGVIGGRRPATARTAAAARSAA